MSSTAKDLTAGTAGGIAQVLVGQPFDIVKVRLQTSPNGTYSGMLACAASIFKNEGPLAFYKGTLSPLVGIGACVSIQFGVLEALKRHFSARNGSDILTPTQLVIAGASAGLANGIVSGPVEHIRIRMQTQPSPPIYPSTSRALTMILSSYGLRGLYTGQIPTFAREGLGFGSYFLCYESLVQNYLAKHPTSTRKDIPSTLTVLYGAAAGYALWFTIYPIDVIKSRMQTDELDPSKRRYRGMLDCARKVWVGEGVGGFTRGIIPTLIRSPFANGATFLFFELTMRLLGSNA